MKSLRWVLALTVPLLVVSAAWAGPPSPEAVSSLLARMQPLPAGWLGIWQVQIQLKDCETQQVIFTSSDQDTICPEEDILTDPDFTYECTGTITDTEFHVLCTGQYEDPPGCVADVSVQFDGSRTGDSFLNVGIFNYTYSGSTCNPEGTFCSRFEMTGTRISTDTSSCQSPVQPSTWGALKARYP